MRRREAVLPWVGAVLGTAHEHGTNQAKKKKEKRKKKHKNNHSTDTAAPHPLRVVVCPTMPRGGDGVELLSTQSVEVSVVDNGGVAPATSGGVVSSGDSRHGTATPSSPGHPHTLLAATHGRSQHNEAAEGGSLLRRLSFWDGVALVVGLMIGSGIFASSGDLLQAAGSPGASLVVWCISGSIVALCSMCYAELGTSIPDAGAEAAYVLPSSFASFCACWLAEPPH